MSKPKFFQRESLFKPVHVEHEVRDQSLSFYPLSVNMLWEMKMVVEPLFQALRVLSTGKNDVERTIDQEQDQDTGAQRIVSHFGAVKPEIATMREERADSAVRKALDSFFDKKTREFVGRMIMDSLRDDFTREQARDPQMAKVLMEGGVLEGEQVDGMDLETLGQMITGLAKANGRVFGPFGQQIKEMLKGKVQDALDDVSGPGRQATSDSSDSSKSEPNDWSENEPLPEESESQISVE